MGINLYTEFDIAVTHTVSKRNHKEQNINTSYLFRKLLQSFLQFRMSAISQATLSSEIHLERVASASPFFRCFQFE